MPQPFLPCSFTFWVQGGCSSTCHHTCPPTIRKWEEARVCFWIILMHSPGRTGTDRRQVTEVTCICKVENWKVAIVQTLTQPLTSCVSSLWLPQITTDLVICNNRNSFFSWFWRPDGQHQFHKIRAPRQDVGRVELLLGHLGENPSLQLLVAAGIPCLPSSLSPLPLSSVVSLSASPSTLPQPCSYNDKCAGPYSPPEQSRVLLMNIISKALIWASCGSQEQRIHWQYRRWVVRSLVWQDPTCRGATKPAPQPLSPVLGNCWSPRT